MRNILFILALGVILLSCSPAGNKPAEVNQSTPEQGRYGAKINAENTISGPQLYSMLQAKDSVWVTLKSKIVANCQKSGCWMDLDMGNDQVIKVTFKDYAFVIPIDSKGKTATVEGFAKKELISVELLKHYAEDEGKPKEEIDAITQDESIYTFEATGVIIED